MTGRSLGLLTGLLLSGCQPATTSETLAHGRFSQITVYPAQSAQQLPIPLLLLGDEPSDRAWIEQATALGRTVFVISPAQLQADFANDLRECRNLAGDFENLARYLEAYLRFPAYVPPVLVAGQGQQALAQQLSAQAPAATWSLSVASSADSASQPSCTATSVPLTVISDANALHQQLMALEKSLPAPPPLDNSVATLPLTEIAGDPSNPRFAIFLSGDGGWAGFDQDLAAALQERGIAVVGWDSLRYFWQAQTPERLAHDLATVIEHYRTKWQKSQVVLLGFSQGANVLPFALQALSTEATVETTAANASNAIVAVALLSPEREAAFEFHLSNWVSATDDGLAVAPVLNGYQSLGPPLHCLYGAGDKDSVCPELSNAAINVVAYPGGHHLNDAIPAIADLLADSSAR
jgi:type IV secretory pathway VirJ component